MSIIGDIVDWEEAHEGLSRCRGATGERYNQRLEAAEQMAEIEARWQHLPGRLHGQRGRLDPYGLSGRYTGDGEGGAD